MREEIKSAEWLENCAKCMEDEGLDRENNARHFRAGADAIRYYLAALTDPAPTDAEAQEALDDFKDLNEEFGAVRRGIDCGGDIALAVSSLEKIAVWCNRASRALSRPAVDLGMVLDALLNLRDASMSSGYPHEAIKLAEKAIAHLEAAGVK